MKPLPANSPSLPGSSTAAHATIPAYLSRTYTWAYLNRRTLPWLDRPLVVSAILWGNAGRLMRAAVAQFEPGQRIVQAACVYGSFSRMLAERVGRGGSLEVVDVAPIQVANARRKLKGLPQVRVRQADLAEPGGHGVDAGCDGVCCFFLLHEVPECQRASIVDNLLGAVRPGGKVVFVDYHRAHRWHPLRPIMAQVFRWLEPYAPSLLEVAIESLTPRAAGFEWQKTTVFGGLYQQVVAVRRG